MWFSYSLAPRSQGAFAAGRVEQLHELPHERRVVVPCPRADQVAVDNHRPVDIGGPALLGVQGALGDRGDGAALDYAGGADDLDPVTDNGHRLAGLKEMPG